MSSQKELIPMRSEDVLRHGREQKGLTLERAARESRIKPAILEAIESGETSHIPSVYLKGYIRSYARFLGLDPRDFDEQLRDVHGADPEVRSVFSVTPRSGGTEKWLKVSSYLAASVLIAALAWQFTHEAVRFSQGEARLNSSAQAEPGAGGEQLSPPVAEKSNGRTHLNASIASVEVMKQRSELAGNNAAEQAWAALDNPQLPAGEHTLELSTSADTWIEIFGPEEQQLEMDLVGAGSTRTYSGPGPFRVMIGRASAVELFLDGEPVELGEHTRGNVANLVLAESPANETGVSEDTENH